MYALAERGVTADEFLRGSSGYKQRLATRENRLVGIRIRRPTFRAAAYRSVQFGGQLVRHGLRLMVRK